MTQDELKRQVGQAAVEYVLAHTGAGVVLGVGTGSTVNCFIDAMAPHRDRFQGAVSSSLASTQRLEHHGFTVIDPNAVTSVPVYVDGADEIDPRGNMVKGGGGALTREKILASLADVFVCIADASKRVPVLGGFPLPIEVVPMARALIERRVRALGGMPTLRANPDGTAFVTDNGHQILDVRGLTVGDPLAFEQQVNAWPGVLTMGVFALQRADMGLFATATGIETVRFG
ncbi:ribose-5-phosphate isomerase RpiA [Robbsia sp. Bb-Pol-6]|uniref:Ribose-5-phosphate isomerase A n=1 Tax=Robbsia betulipollinis TaxID=2981849 RepID=A0ABT3ZIY3_9BURK|nr:ribose-5-phosphate isomerase RpiA [Robbsia betulipollinis]MCY0386392.1 ribose-5-phosphate isomerase RpiA [Robbsia betulipollinis]